MASILNKTKQYYKVNKISALKFRCPHRRECKSGCTDFTGAKEPFIGTEYDKGSLPRILFVSLDSGSGEESASDRTAEVMRRWEEHDYHPSDESNGAKRKHWYQTHVLALMILKAFRPTLTLESINPFFAHTNSVKCSQNKDRKEQADSILFRNCRGYLGGEIKVLAPEILVTQGDQARSAVQYAVKQRDISLLSALGTTCSYKVLEVGRKKVLWLHMYHPQARCNRFFVQRRQCWNRWVKIAVNWYGKNR